MTFESWGFKSLRPHQPEAANLPVRGLDTNENNHNTLAPGREMLVTETLSEGLKREFKVVVDADQIEDKLTSRLTELARQAQMPGFRPGKVPVALLRKTHGKNVLGEVLEQIVNDSTSKAFEDHEIQPALQPKIEVTQFEEGTDLEYSIAVEIMPAIEAMDFSELKLTRLVVEVEDKEVDERIEGLVKQFREFEDAEESHAAAMGDTVVIDFKGSVGGEVFDGGEAQDFSLEIGSSQFVPGFEDQLIGAKAGEELTVTVTFPEGYGAEDLAGKEAEFAVTVTAIKVAQATAIDDSLAEKLGLENLEALKNAIRQQVQGENAEYSRMRLKRELLDELAEAHEFEVPPGMVEMEFESIWGELLSEMERNKQSFEGGDKSEEETREEYRSIAIRRVRLGLLLSEVGRTSNLEVLPEEINRKIAEQARSLPGQEQQLLQFYQENPQAQAQLRAPILEDKVVDFILEMAQISENKVSLEELMRDPDEEEEVKEAVEAENKPKKRKKAAKKKTAAKASKGDADGGEDA